MTNRLTCRLLAAALLVSLLATTDFAQTSYNVVPRPSYPAFPGGGRGYGGGYGWGGYGGATAAGSYLNGMANVVRSAGYYNVMNSIATQNYEQAYSADLDNRLKATNTYFEMRRANRAARAEEAPPRATSAELAQYAADMAPKRLTSSELDPVNGSIDWPAILKDGRYDKFRDDVDRLFSQRVATSGSPTNYREINAAIDTFRSTLIKNLSEYPPNVYMQARRFLDSLQYESRFLAS